MRESIGLQLASRHKAKDEGLIGDSRLLRTFNFEVKICCAGLFFGGGDCLASACANTNIPMPRIAQHHLH